MARQSRPVRRGDGGGRLLLLLGVLALVALASWRWKSRPRPGSVERKPGSGSVLDVAVAREFAALEAAEREADRTVWAPEQLAQAHGANVEALWEALQTSADGLGLLRELRLRSLSLVPAREVESMPHGILRMRGVDSIGFAPWPDWRERVDRWRAEGWRLDQSEWRHVGFVPATNGQPATSGFEVSLDLSRTNPVERAEVTARARVTWAQESSGAGTDMPPQAGLGDVVVEGFDVRRRAGGPAFREVHVAEFTPFARTSWIDPVIVRERADGPELILAARNVVLRRGDDGKWMESLLSTRHPGLVFTALLADFDGDGLDDVLWAVRSGLVLSRGDADGRFETDPVPVWSAPVKLEYAQAFTCGDFDGDGDLDVFLGQYRPPYVGGQMPRPYFDANDGPPTYLLRNGGSGGFEDVTDAAGLASKRHRRSYGASLVDLDGDGDMDLVVTSDFAGMDVHLNDGRGTFRDVTGTMLDDPRGFGMSHAFADFDADGRLDLLMVAMPQPTADRLGAAGLERPGLEPWAMERRRMVHGNRLFFGRPEGFRQRAETPGLAWCGWAWSAAVLDFDHDRFPDLHVVNGHETRASVKDYEREFWTHDIYVGDSTARPAVDAYFASKFAVTRSWGWSYGGHERNRLLWNRGGGGFVSVGHLFGLSLAADSRNAVAGDLDGDGDEDLVVTTFEIWPRVRQTVRVYENTLEQTGNWIGFRLTTKPGGTSAMGATVTVRDRLGAQVKTLVSGDGYRSQSGRVLRFGLGDVTQVDRVEVRWVGGATSALTNPPTGQIHPLEGRRRRGD